MIASKPIDDFLTSLRPHAVCERCIATSVGMEADALRSDRIAQELGTSGDFTQEAGTCSICLAETSVIRRL